jgi:sugar lactone lactonase YvrE
MTAGAVAFRSKPFETVTSDRARNQTRIFVIGPPMTRGELGTVRRAGVVAGVVAGVGLCAVVPVGAEPEPEPPLGHAERVAGLSSPAAGASGYSGDGFAATKARIGFNAKIATAADGAVLLVDSNSRRLRRVGTDGVIDTVPAPAPVSGGGPWFARGATPWMVDSGPDGSVYLSDRQEISRLGKDGSWTTIAGGGEVGFADGRGGDGGPATNAFLYDIENLDVDAAGVVYVADGGNGRVRRVDRNGTITTVAGGGRTTPSTRPVPARSARLHPFDIAVDPAGGFWMVDYARLEQAPPRLVHVDADGMLTAVPLDAEFTQGFPIAVGADSTVYIGVGAFLHRLAEDGSTTPLGGPFTDSITDIAIAPDGTFYTATHGVVERLVEPGSREGEKVRPTRAAPDRWAGDEPGTVHRVAGDGKYRESAGAVPDQAPTEPRDIVAAPGGGAYVLDGRNERVLSVSPAGAVEEFATLPSRDAAAIVGLARGSDGALYTLDVNSGTLLRIGPDGAVTNANAVSVAESYRPTTTVLDKAGNTYLPADDGEILLRSAPGGRTVPLAGGGDREGAEADGRPARQASMYLPQAAAIAPDGSVAVLEEYLNAVRLVRPDGSLTTIAGNADARLERAGFGGDGGPATRALLNSPRAAAFAPDGTVYVADTMNNRVRKVARNGVITTVAGTGERDETGDGGPATRAALVEPDHVAVAEDGALWVTSAASTRVRRIDRDGTITTPVDFEAADHEASAVPAEKLTLDGYAIAVDRKGTVYVDAAETIRAVSSGKARTAFDTTGLGGPMIATGADGSLYYGGATVRHRFPDGAETPVVGALQQGVAPADGANANTVNIVPTDIAVDPDGTPLIATKEAVFALAGGRLDQRWHLDDPDAEQINGIAPGPDGTLYVALSEDRVVAVRDGKTRTFAGAPSAEDDDDIGDGGPATDAQLDSPRDVAVTSDGSVFVSTTDGIRRINPEGDIDTVVAGQSVEEGSLTQDTPPEALAVDAHDNLYFTEPQLNQVRVVVRPAAMPDQSGTSLWWWLGGGALLVAAAAFLLWRRTTSNTADPAPATEEPEPVQDSPDGPSEDK